MGKQYLPGSNPGDQEGRSGVAAIWSAPFYSVFKNPCKDLLTQHYWSCPPMTDGRMDRRMDKESALLLMNEHDMSPMLRVNIHSI